MTRNQRSREEYERIRKRSEHLIGARLGIANFMNLGYAFPSEIQALGSAIGDFVKFYALDSSFKTLNSNYSLPETPQPTEPIKRILDTDHAGRLKAIIKKYPDSSSAPVDDVVFAMRYHQLLNVHEQILESEGDNFKVPLIVEHLTTLMSPRLKD